MSYFFSNQLKQGKLQLISSPNQYYLEIQDKDLATVSGSSVIGKQLGRTSVILRDRNVLSGTTNNENGSETIIKSPTPKAILTIVKPDKITINLLPHYNWITIEGEKHEIIFDLFTR